ATHSLGDQQTLLVANAVAQSQALLVGRRGDELRRELAQQGSRGAALEAAIAARECPGNRASTTLLLPKLAAHNLGALLALFEHQQSHGLGGNSRCQRVGGHAVSFP